MRRNYQVMRRGAARYGQGFETFLTERVFCSNSRPNGAAGVQIVHAILPFTDFNRGDPMKQFSDASKVALLLLALTLPAVAQKPTIQVFPFTSFFIPAAEGCGFDVLLTPEPGRPNGERLIEFANITILQGPLFVTVKNLSTGKTINVNISGPGQAQPGIFSFPNTLVAEGPGIPGALPANVAAAAGLPLVPVTYGRTVFTSDAQGNLTSVSFTGTVQDLCQLLQ